LVWFDKKDYPLTPFSEPALMNHGYEPQNKIWKQIPLKSY